jgi:hypothetical protein
LGTPYPGVDAPVVDMLRAARVGCDISPVTITGGDQQHRNGTAWSVPKRDLIAVVQVLLERKRIEAGTGAAGIGGAGAGVDRYAVDPESWGRVRLGADGCGEHDDLVIALALACWRARQGPIGFGTRRLPGIQGRL